MNTIEYSNNIYIIYIIIMYYILNYIILFIYTRHFPLKRACRAVIPVALVTLTEVTIHLKDQICWKTHDQIRGKAARVTTTFQPVLAEVAVSVCPQLINSNHSPMYIVSEWHSVSLRWLDVWFERVDIDVHWMCYEDDIAQCSCKQKANFSQLNCWVSVRLELCQTRSLKISWNSERPDVFQPFLSLFDPSSDSDLRLGWILLQVSAAAASRPRFIHRGTTPRRGSSDVPLAKYG